MDDKANFFELDFKGGKIRVQRHTLAGTQTVYQVVFSDGRKPLVLTRATHANALHFWTSLPEGRQEEAQQIGPLIEEHYK